MDNEQNMGNEQSAEILIEDGPVELTLGTATVPVNAMTIEHSVQWSKRVRRAWAAQGATNQAVINAMAADEEPIAQLAALDKGLDGGAMNDILVARDLLLEHSPKIMTAEVLNEATARQIVSGFLKVYANENPMRELRAGWARAQ